MIRDELANWAKWVTRVNDCYPDGYACYSIEGRMWHPYRNAHQSIDEKLEELESRLEPDEHAAVRVERWIANTAEPYRCAIRVEWVECPEYERVRWRQTHEEWQGRKMRLHNHELRRLGLGHHYARDVTAYEDAVASAEELLDRQLTMWQRAA